MLGQRYTTLMITAVCPVTKLHHMASLQSDSSCNCTSYAGIVSLMYTSVVTIHRCIDVSRYLSRDMYRDTVCNNRDTRDLVTFLRFLFECLTDINCQSAKNYQCRLSSHPQQTAGSYSQLKSIKLCCMSVISNKWSYD